MKSILVPKKCSYAIHKIRSLRQKRRKLSSREISEDLIFCDFFLNSDLLSAILFLLIHLAMLMSLFTTTASLISSKHSHFLLKKLPNVQHASKFYYRGTVECDHFHISEILKSLFFNGGNCRRQQKNGFSV